MKIKGISTGVIAFLQATGLTVYCGLVALLLWRGSTWFGKVPNYLVPFLFLILFTTSALVCGLVTLGYPFILFWQQKKTVQAVRLVAYTTGWLLVYTFLVIIALATR